ncbi:uncharacterized protein ACR2FA_005642 [Aphomia sociella]
MDATLQRIMTSFKHFEKKLDKLQDDVNYYGQTLSELRLMVASLSNAGDTKIAQDGKSDEAKRLIKKNTAIQYDDLPHMEEGVKVKRKAAIQPFPNKIKVKSFPGQKYELTSSLDPSFLNKLPTNAKVLGKHTLRPGKADAPRKATTLRIQKGMDKKRSKV